MDWVLRCKTRLDSLAHPGVLFHAQPNRDAGAGGFCVAHLQDGREGGREGRGGVGGKPVASQAQQLGLEAKLQDAAAAGRLNQCVDSL